MSTDLHSNHILLSVRVRSIQRERESSVLTVVVVRYYEPSSIVYVR